jgi:hypothetical protein
MRRHPIRALALLLSLPLATSTTRASAQADAAGPPSTAPVDTAAPAPPAAAQAPPTQPQPASTSAAPASPTPASATPASAALASAAKSPPAADAAPSLAPYPGEPARARVASPKPLPPRVVEPFPSDAPPPLAASIPSVAAWLGINTLWIPSDGFDPFSENDALTLFDLGTALSIAGDDALDVAAVVTWGAAASDADYRTQPAELDVMRFSAGAELRGSIVDRVYWHGRLSPTATRVAAELDETSSQASFVDTRWAFGVDAALGLDVRFVEAHTALPEALGFFLRVEAGYAWTQSLELELEPRGGAPVRSEPITLPELALGGPLLRASLGAGF